MRVKVRSRHVPTRLLSSVDDATAGRVVWRDFDENGVAWENPDVIFPHFPGYSRQDAVLLAADIDFHAKHGVGERCRYGPFRLDGLDLRHTIATPRPHICCSGRGRPPGR